MCDWNDWTGSDKQVLLKLGCRTSSVWLFTDMAFCFVPQWTELPMILGTDSPVPVLQACSRRTSRSVLSQWMERGEAHHLMMDITFAQEVEPLGQLSPLQVHLFGSDTPIRRFQNSWEVLNLQASRWFPATAPQNEISSYLTRSLALSLGSVRHRGFQLAFSYSGTCVLLASIRLYYRRCPDIVEQLTRFGRTGAGSGPLNGSCVSGAVEVSPLVRECDVDGVWGPLKGACTCKPGHHFINDSCQGMQTWHFLMWAFHADFNVYFLFILIMISTVYSFLKWSHEGELVLFMPCTKNDV